MYCVRHTTSARPFCPCCAIVWLLQGTAAVAAVLASNHSIYTLSLAGCPLRDEGAMALAEALKTNISLYKLDLSNCLVSRSPLISNHPAQALP